jgi:hypothetical protein
LAETLSYNCEKLGINSKGNRVFLTNKILMQRGRGKKMKFKITRVIIMNLEIYGENFMIFG